MADVTLQAALGLDLDEFSARLGELPKTAADTGAKLAGSFDETNRATGETAQRLDIARDKLNAYGNAGAFLTGLYASWKAVSGAISTVANATISAGQAMLDAQISAEKLATGLQFAIGGNVGREIDYLRSTTRELGLDFASTAASYTKFAAAARETSLEGEGARKVFEAVARASTVMGLSAAENQGVLLALSQMMSKGTVQAEELRGQLGERMPGAFQIAARAMGVTTAELGKMLEQGRVISEDFLPRFAAQLQHELGDSAARAGERTEASLNRLSSAWEQMKQAIAGSGVAAFIAGQLNILTDAMDDVSGSIRRAKDEGGGFWSQFGAGLAAVVRFQNPLNAFSYQVQDTGEQLKAAQAELAGLQAALEKQPNNLMLKNAVKDTRELVAELERAKQGAAEYRDQFERPGQAAQIRAAIDQQREYTKASSEVLRIQTELSGQQKTFGTNLAALHNAYERGALSLDAYRDLVAKLITAQGGVAKATKEAKDSTDKAAEAAVKLRASLLDEVSAMELSRAGTGKLTDAQKLMLKIGEALRDNKVQMTDAEKLAVFGRLEAIAAAETLARREDDLLKLGQASIGSEIKRIETLRQTVEKLREENAALGLSGAALAQLNIAKQETILLDLRRKALVPELSAAELAAIEAQIRLQGELVSLMRDGAVRRESIAAAEAATKAWDQAAQQMGQSLTDWIMSGGKNARDYVVGLFRSAVLTPLLRPVMTGITGAIGSALGIAPATASASGGGSGLGLLGNIGGALGAFGGSLGAGVFGGLGSIGLTGGVGLGGTLSAAGSLIGTGSAAGIGAGLGMGIGALAPYLAAGYAIYSIAKSLFGSKGGPKVGGSFESAPFAGGDRWVTGAGKLFSETQQDAQAADLARSWQQALAATAAALGGSAAGLQYGIGFAADPQGSAANRVAGFVGGSYFNDPDVARTEEAMQAAIARTMAQMTLAGLQQSDLPAVFADYFRRFDLAAATEEQVQAAIAAATAAQQMAEAVAGLGGVFRQMSGVSVEARGNILALTGGLDAFVQKVGGYVGAFYSQEEQAAIQARSIAQALAGAGVDITGLDTKSEFRSLVDALDLSSDTGQAQLAALLNVAQGFAGLADYMSQQGVTLEELAGMAPVDRLAELTAAGQRTQESQLASIDSRLQAVEAALGQVVGAVQASAGAIGSAVAGAVQDVATRPVVVSAGEVNGGFA